MAVIQWQVPTLGLDLRWGLDKTARPTWFTVPYRGSKQLLLQFGKGQLVKSINPPIADVSHDGDEGQNSFYVIEGKMPGNARIEVRDPRTRELNATLAVNVKTEKEYGVSFNFCEDGSYNKTVLQPGIANDLIAGLNSIYMNQTSITFSLLKAAPLELKMIMGDIVREQPDVVDPKEKTGYSRLGQSSQWDKVFAANADNGFNIYFVPSDKPAAQNDTLIYTKGDNCIIEDGRQLPSYTLAHAIGRMLGCPFTSDPNKMNHLMFWHPGVGKNFFSRSDNFIPRDNANVMNPG